MIALQGAPFRATLEPPIPYRAGIALNPKSDRNVLPRVPHGGWFETPIDIDAGAVPDPRLTAIRSRFPLSVHCAALPLGAEEGMPREHLSRLAKLIKHYDPGLVSLSLAGSMSNGRPPLAYTLRTLMRAALQVDEVQVALRRQVLVGNPSGFARCAEDDFPETEFLRALVRRTRCGLLLDIGHVLASARTYGFDAEAHLDAFPIEHVAEIRLTLDGADAVDGPELNAGLDHIWALYSRTIARLGPVPTVIATGDGTFAALAAGVERADAIMGVGAMRGTA